MSAERIASLPMYNLPEVRSANAALWRAIAGHLRAAGIPGVPDDLADRPAVPVAIESAVLFTQTCGYPLMTRYRGQARVLAAPRYSAPGCEGVTYRSAFVVVAGSPATVMEDLRGGIFGVNSPHSNSGMNLPRIAVARLAGGRPFFSKVVTTGGHVQSLEMIAAGAIDTAAIDCITYALVRRHHPGLAAVTRVLDWTPVSPSLPFVTSMGTEAAAAAALRHALAEVATDPAVAAAREALLLAGIDAIDERDYTIVLDYEAEAARLGYPALA